MGFEKEVGKYIVLYTTKGFRFQGKILSFDGRFLKIHDDVKNIEKNLNIEVIGEFDISDKPFSRSK